VATDADDAFVAPGSRPADVISRVARLLLQEVADTESAAQIALAERRAAALLRAGDESRPSALPLLGLVARGLNEIAAAAEREPSELRLLLERAAEEAGVAVDAFSTGVYQLAVRDPALLELPPDLTIELQLRLLVAVAPVDEASLWIRSERKTLTCLARVGSTPVTRGVRATATRTLDGAPPIRRSSRSTLHGVPVDVWGRPHAALVIRSAAAGGEAAMTLAEELALALAPTLEKAALLERSAEREQSLVHASERRLVRLGFDLHDGPLQDVAAVTAEVRLFKRQLGASISDSRVSERLLGRVDDVEARLRAIDADLRELARWLEAPTLLRVPFDELVRKEVERLEAATNVRVSLKLQGDPNVLTPSQRIALLRVVEAALANVREHSDAATVRMSITVGRAGVRAEIVDDGTGFDVEDALLRAAREGRLGVIGMSERIRLLGGSFDLRSRPGGPTTVSAVLPHWRGGDDAHAVSSSPPSGSRA
jgi:signal transduction histidine kinase